MMFKKSNTVMAAAVAMVVFCGSVMAEGIISLGFFKTGDSAFSGGSNIGPLATDSANWNSTLGQDNSGSLTDLTDDDGIDTTADVVWTSANTWRNGVDNAATDEHRLAKSYLDDGNGGCSVTFSNIPYATYRVYGLLSSDAGDLYNTCDFQINGLLWVNGESSSAVLPAYGNITTNNGSNGTFWTEIGGGTRGNFWTEITSGSTLTIQGQDKWGGGRGSLAGVIIEEVTDVPNTISVNLVQGNNQTFAGNSEIGPLVTSSLTWNSTAGSPVLKSGTKSNLVDRFGFDTGASVLWKSANTYYNGRDGVGDDEHKLAVGYLDDGSGGCSVTFSNIPYANYKVYGLLSSDEVKDAPYTTLDFMINGGVWARGGVAAQSTLAYGNINLNNATNGTWWTETTSSTTGNYWTVEAIGSTLTIDGLQRAGAARGSLAGVVIEETALVVSTNRMIGFNWRGNGASGTMDLIGIAGAPGYEQRHWGNLNSDWFDNSGAVPTKIFDSYGALVGENNDAAKGIRLEFDGSGLYSNGIIATNADFTMMWGYMDDGFGPAQPYIQIYNIPYQRYDLIVYVDGDANNGGKCGPYWLEEVTDPRADDGADLTPLVYTEQIGSPHFDGTYTQVPLTSTAAATAAAGNYIVFTGMTTNNITLRSQRVTGTRSPINAFQIIDTYVAPIPQPLGTILLLQ